ncbi:hypothetical protein OIU85_001841 [Salix viminalis]|uniref:Uncharacterized protein n=1 Tax=Salix viminalis TaxID=40686 RepID=A0A9Q0ZY89_SALVM|nr:hypothetical protein OIU85_001841 [Salix viminalis]
MGSCRSHDPNFSSEIEKLARQINGMKRFPFCSYWQLPIGHQPGRPVSEKRVPLVSTEWILGLPSPEGDFVSLKGPLGFRPERYWPQALRHSEAEYTSPITWAQLMPMDIPPHFELGYLRQGKSIRRPSYYTIS